MRDKIGWSIYGLGLADMPICWSRPVRPLTEGRFTQLVIRGGTLRGILG